MFRFFFSAKPLALLTSALALFASLNVGAYIGGAAPTQDAPEEPVIRPVMPHRLHAKRIRVISGDRFFEFKLPSELRPADSVSSKADASDTESANSNQNTSIPEKEEKAPESDSNAVANTTEPVPEETSPALQETVSNVVSEDPPDFSVPNNETDATDETIPENNVTQEQEPTVTTNAIQEEMATRKGMIGRLQVPALGIDVALFDSAKTEEDSQTICDWPDAAVLLPHYGRQLIGDHCNQAFSTLKNAQPGTYMYITDGIKTSTYVCVENFDGTNIKSDLIRGDTNTSIIEDDFDGLTLYTCKTNWSWKHVIITYWASSSQVQNNDSSNNATKQESVSAESTNGEEDSSAKTEAPRQDSVSDVQTDATDETIPENNVTQKQEPTATTNAIQEEMATRKGMIGRLQISSLVLDVALFDWAKTGEDTQTIYGWEDAAVQYPRRGKTVIADWSEQGFGVITQAQPGTNMRITDGVNVTTYVCVEVCSACKSNRDILRLDTNEDICQNDFNGLILFTGPNNNITVTYWQRCS